MMPRKAREISSTGIYHVVMRGVNKCSIFLDKEDKQKFIKTLIYYRRKCGLNLYAYCLMDNHVHFLLKEGNESLSLTLQRIGTSYVSWFNRKHGRCGHLFQDRYKSERVEDDAYFLTVIRYIHQNPLKAGLVKNLKDYHWSSYQLYMQEVDFIEKTYVLKMFSPEIGVAYDSFEKFHKISEQQKCLEDYDRKTWNDREASELIKKMSGKDDCKMIKKFDLDKRRDLLNSLISEGLTALQISRITGIGRWIIYNTVNKEVDNSLDSKI